MPGFEELEAVAPIDILRRAGVDVTVAGLDDPVPTGRNGIRIATDAPLADVAARVFDAVVLPGGPGVARLRASPEVLGLVQRQAAAGRWVAAICAAPLVLHDAGVLAGRRFTCHPSAARELAGADAASAVVEDGNIVTSRGAGTAVLFGLALAARLTTSERAAEVAASICHPA